MATGHSGYGNVYPADITKALEPIAWEARFGQTYTIIITGDRANWEARFGQTYTIIITGDRANGYQAVLHP